VDFGFQYSFQLYRRLNKFVFTGLGCQPNAQPPTWRTRVSLLAWNLTLDLSGLGDPASSYITAGVALEIIGARKPHHHDKAETPPGRKVCNKNTAKRCRCKMPSFSHILRFSSYFTFSFDEASKFYHQENLC
jgi:hypothetical protein